MAREDLVGLSGVFGSGRRSGSMAEPLALDDLLYLVVVSVTFDPDDFELRWPPQLFVDEASRVLGLQGEEIHQEEVYFSNAGIDIEWLLTEAFASSVPFRSFIRLSGREQARWIVELIRAAATLPEPSLHRPYWSARAAARGRRPQMEFDDVTRRFILVVEEFEANGYLAQVFGQKCVKDRDSPPLPDRAMILEERAGYPVAHWPLGETQPGWELDAFCDLVEVFHDLVARPTTRSWHSVGKCGWHYGAFATRPARRLYRWRINRLLGASALGLRLAESGEDLGRLVRIEPSGLEDLPERAVQAAAPETVHRVQHAIALFRARAATLEERRSAVIALAGILEERRDLLKAELLTKDETALFQIANQFAVRHQRADQRGDYDPAFLDWLFWWYLDTVQLTDQLLAHQAPGSTPASEKGA
jgi:hypothetical protein